MSASQFDDLLGDFGDSTTTTTKTSSNGAFDDDFDPFGPSSDAAPTANGGDSGLLLDFSADAEIKNGGSSNGVDFEFSTTTDTDNQLFDMSADTQSSNPLYDMSSGSANPLYDLSADADANQSANPLYEFSAGSSNSAPTNPLYDFDNEGTSENAQEEIDFLSGTNQQPEEEDSAQASGDLLGGFEESQSEESPDTIHVEYQPQIMNGDPKEWVGAPEEEEEEEVQPELQEEEEDVEEEQLLDYSERVESVDEAPAPIAHTENDYVEEEEEEEEASEPPPVPAVEITESPDQVEPEVAVTQETLPDLVVREEGDEQEAAEEDQSATGGGAFSSEPAASGQQEPVATENFGHDRREVDLEHYCMDREESDYMDEQDQEPHMDSLKPREERSRSPSRSIGPDTPEDRERLEPSDTPESTDATDECDQLRAREDRSHAPSRSLEPEERPKDEQQQDSPVAAPQPTSSEKRFSGSGFDSAQTSEWEQEKNRQNASSGQKDITNDMASSKSRFESEPAPPPQKQFDYQKEVESSEGGIYESQPQPSQQWEEEEEEEEGVYESQPQQRDDVVREADYDKTKDLPAAGTAQNLRARFLAEAQQSSTPVRSQREITPPPHGSGGEYVSEPRAEIERYEGKAEAGVFESEPVEANPDIITSNTVLEDARYQGGYAKSAAAKYKELTSQTYTPSSKRELTPDRSGQVEYVSEPRGQAETYEGKAESGVFESEPQINPDVIRSGEVVSDEPLPERGTAKNLASKFKQMSETTYTPRPKKELTPDRTGRVEYVSEPSAPATEEYEVRVDAGVFENQPQRNADVVTSDSVPEEYVPEKGFAKNVAARFREMESTAKSPPLSPGRRKEFTPPREDERIKQLQSDGVRENSPEARSDVIHSGDQTEEKLPERGTAKNIAQRFQQMSENKSPVSPRQKKEFTPPPQSAGGVYENEPQQFHADYNRPAESGIIENNPLKRDDVVRGDEPPKYEAELPERGAAKNLVSKWRQIESESAKARSPDSRGRYKEFTPPREEPRIAEYRKSPRTPLSPGGHSELDNGSVHPTDLPGQYQPQNEPSIFESNPEQRPDVLREADSDHTEGLPKKNTAKKMLAKFQSLQAEANKQPPAPISRKDEPETKRRTPRKAQNVRNQ